MNQWYLSESFALVPLVIVVTSRVHLALHLLGALSLDLLLSGSCVTHPCEVVVHSRVHVPLVVDRGEGSWAIFIHGRWLCVA